MIDNAPPGLRGRGAVYDWSEGAEPPVMPQRNESTSQVDASYRPHTSSSLATLRRRGAWLFGMVGVSIALVWGASAGRSGDYAGMATGWVWTAERAPAAVGPAPTPLTVDIPAAFRAPLPPAVASHPASGEPGADAPHALVEVITLPPSAPSQPMAIEPPRRDGPAVGSTNEVPQDASAAAVPPFTELAMAGDIYDNSQAAPTIGEYSYEDMLRAVAEHYTLDWRLLAAMVYQESRFNPRALGADDDMGLMQIMPGTWEEVAPRVGVSDPFDPYSNAQVGARYLVELHYHFIRKGYPELYWAVLAYNWGPANVTRLLDSGGVWEDVPAHKQWYVWSIMQEAVDQQATWWNSHLKSAPYPEN